MTTIVFPDNTDETIDAIRTAIGRNVIFVEKIESLCPTCTLDPISNTSTNAFCPTCSGVGYIYTTSGYTVMAHITWGGSELPNWQSAGYIFDGDCRIQIKYTPEAVLAIKNSDYIVVDDKRLTVKKKILRGVPNINRILLDLKVQESED